MLDILERWLTWKFNFTLFWALRIWSLTCVRVLRTPVAFFDTHMADFYFVSLRPECWILHKFTQIFLRILPFESKWVHRWETSCQAADDEEIIRIQKYTETWRRLTLVEMVELLRHYIFLRQHIMYNIIRPIREQGYISKEWLNGWVNEYYKI